jgi:hypothetical protein
MNISPGGIILPDSARPVETPETVPDMVTAYHYSDAERAAIAVNRPKLAQEEKKRGPMRKLRIPVQTMSPHPQMHGGPITANGKTFLGLAVASEYLLPVHIPTLQQKAGIDHTGRLLAEWWGTLFPAAAYLEIGMFAADISPEGQERILPAQTDTKAILLKLRSVVDSGANKEAVLSAIDDVIEAMA